MSVLGVRVWLDLCMDPGGTGFRSGAKRGAGPWYLGNSEKGNSENSGNFSKQVLLLDSDIDLPTSQNFSFELRELFT